MSKPGLLVMDTLMDRRDVHGLLDRLPPKARVRFVGWCCRQIPAGPTRPHPRYDRDLLDLAYRDDGADRRVTNATYADLLNLSAQWGLDLAAAAVELERWVRATR